MKKPLVSVWMITYNHERYIAQAIESVLKQITTFPLELVIGEDCSTDNTRRICENYESNYPGVVRVLKHEMNLGIHENIIVTLRACLGEFVALLEGDDYWTDEYKLQKQVDALMNHPEFIMCYQKTIEIDEVSGNQKITNENDRDVTGIPELLERGWFMRTGSIMFRNGVLKGFPDWFYQFSSTDYMLHILVAEFGQVRFLNEVTSVYRRHPGGITQDFQNAIIGFNERKLKLLNILDEYFNGKYHRELNVQRRSIYNACFVTKLKQIRRLSDLFYVIKLLPYISYGGLSKRFLSYAAQKIYFTPKVRSKTW